MKSNHYLAAVYLSIAFLVSACGGGGGGGGGGGSATANTGATTSTAGSEGTATSPVILSSAGSYSGKVALSGPSYYLVSGLSAGATYSVTFSNIVGSIIPFLYSSDTMTNLRTCYYSAVSATASCIVQASPAGSIFISTVDRSVSDSSTYDISLALAVDAGQGDPTTPVAIVSPNSFTGTLTNGVSTSTYDPGNSGYYSITGLIPGHRYSITLSAITVGADLYVYQNSLTGQACSSTTGGTGSKFCTLTAKSSSILLRVEARDSGSFTISYTDNGLATVFTSEGSVGAEIPLVLDKETSLSKSTVNETKSYYTVGGLVPGQSYYAYLGFMSDNVNLYVYRDSAYTDLACSSTLSGTQNESCKAVPDAKGQLWIIADGTTALTNLGSKYDIGVQRIAPLQGTSALPQNVNGLTELPYRVSGTPGASYYKITGLAPNTTYMTVLTTSRSVAGDFPNMTVYPPTGFGGMVACSSGGYYGHCSGSTDASGALFIKISSNNQAGGTSYINVNAMPVSEGTATVPLAKNMAAQATPNKFTGQMSAGTDSYYALTGLTPNTSYYMLASFGGGQSAGIKAFNTFSGDLSTQALTAGMDCSMYWSYLNNGCAATSDANGMLWIDMQSFAVSVGSYFTLEALPVPVSQGLISTPVDITASLPYRATVGGGTNGGTSYYTVTGLVANGEYLFSKSDTSAGEYLSVYNDINLTVPVCLPDLTYTGREAFCRGKPTGSVVYILVSNAGYQMAPSYFYLDVTAVPPAEGSAAAPKLVTSGSTGSVNVGVSYYQASLAANTTYTVSLTGVTGDPDLYVFDNAAMTGSAGCSSIKGRNQAESCQATSDANGKLWIFVDGELSRNGGRYTINIQ